MFPQKSNRSAKIHEKTNNHVVLPLSMSPLLCQNLGPGFAPTQEMPILHLPSWRMCQTVCQNHSETLFLSRKTSHKVGPQNRLEMELFHPYRSL